MNTVKQKTNASATLLAILLAGTLLPAASAYAGTLRNADSRTYTYRIFWDDLSPTEKDTIKPNEEKKFDDKPCTIELINQLDNIFVRPHESIVIRGGILHTKKPH